MTTERFTALLRILWPVAFSIYLAVELVPPLVRLTASISPGAAVILALAAALQVGHAVVAALTHFLSSGD